MLAIGLMSGTSMDGIDVALLETDGTSKVIKELAHTSLSYAPSFKILLKAAEYAVRKDKGDLKKAENHFQETLADYLEKELSCQDVALAIKELKEFLAADLTLSEVIQLSTHFHAEAVKKLLSETNFKAKDIAVVGYHGQTLYHQPRHKVSVIVGDGQSLSNLLGITVVNDFRRSDIENGGEGAPFAPLYHLALAIRDQKIPAAIVNCGGISNITIILSREEKDLVAFDTGPGNGLIDRFVRQRTNGKENMDFNGCYGKVGKVQGEVLKALFEKGLMKDGQNYFDLPPPKSLDIGDMVLIPELAPLSLEDGCATLAAFTAESIVKSLDLLKDKAPKNWFLAGGGWKNPLILERLKSKLQDKLGSQVWIQTADEGGWNSQALEAQIFAFLAVRALKGLPLSMPGTTGVSKPLSGGHVYIPNSGGQLPQ